MTFVDPCDGQTTRPKLVEPPVYVPWKFGLLSAANVIPFEGTHERMGVAYKSPPCQAGVILWDDNCDRNLLVAKAATDVDRDAIVRGCPFLTMAKLTCKTTTLDAMRGEVARVHQLGVQRAVEEAVWSRVLVNLADPATTVNTVPGAAGALGVVAAIAALESSIAACYGGQATIHADRALAPYMADAHQLRLIGDSRYETVLGSRVAFYAGGMLGLTNLGPDGLPAPAGMAWIYATSLLTLRQSEVDVLPEDGGHILAYDPMTNEPQVIAEQLFVATIECCKFAALVCLSNCS